MGQWCCKGCGQPEWGWVYWRIRNASGGVVCDRPSLADCQRLLRTYPWAKGCKIYRVTRSKKAARCYWPPMQVESALESLRAVPPSSGGEK